MGNNIDLKNINIRTDLAIESINNTKITPNIKSKRIDNIVVEKIIIKKNEEKIIGKKKGIYVTISFEDVTNFEDREKLGKILEQEIKKLFKTKKISDTSSGLVIGLGNVNSTPDALGPLVIDNILVTRHLFLTGVNVKDGIREIAAISPGVTATTGIETSDYVKSIVSLIKPSFVIIIDSLAASSIERVNKTIQMTDTGIHPGSGVGNSRKEISESTLNIPVIAIGIPTVVSASTIVNETINYLFKHLSYIKDNSDLNKLTVRHFTNYLDKIKNLDLDNLEKENLLGIIGSLSDDDKKRLINEVLTAINYNLIVTPKEIDFVINKISNVISNSLNNAMHRQITHY